MNKIRAPRGTSARIRAAATERAKNAERRRLSAAAAAAEYEAVRLAVSANTERLRALRLAGDAKELSGKPARSIGSD